MKRYWSTPEYARRVRRLQRRSLRQRRRKPSGVRSTPRTRVPRDISPHKRLSVPKTLDLFSAPHECTKLLKQFSDLLRKKDTHVFLDLSHVESFSNDALIAIRAMMRSARRSHGATVSGNIPDDQQVAAEFKASGFFDGIAVPPPDLPPPKGIVRSYTKDRVHADIAAELVSFARRHVHISQESANACSQNLIELMTNTHNHAGYTRNVRRGQKPIHHTWFTSVYCTAGVAHFSFVDLGRGILGATHHQKRWRRLDASLRPRGRAKLLEDVFTGKFGSVTQDKGRGYGLPRLRRDAVRRKLGEARVFTADVFGGVKANRYRTTETPLQGTLFTWSVGEKRGD